MAASHRAGSGMKVVAEGGWGWGGGRLEVEAGRVKGGACLRVEVTDEGRDLRRLHGRLGDIPKEGRAGLGPGVLVGVGNVAAWVLGSEEDRGWSFTDSASQRSSTLR